jgi:hypothetical protein
MGAGPSEVSPLTNNNFPVDMHRNWYITRINLSLARPMVGFLLVVVGSLLVISSLDELYRRELGEDGSASETIAIICYYLGTQCFSPTALFEILC